MAAAAKASSKRRPSAGAKARSSVTAGSGTVGKRGSVGATKQGRPSLTDSTAPKATKSDVQGTESADVDASSPPKPVAEAAEEEVNVSFLPDEEEDFEEDGRPKKIWVKATGPDGEVQKALVSRRAMTYEIRKAVCAVFCRSYKDTELILDGEMLKGARERIFDERGPPYEIEWEHGDRLAALMERHKLATLKSRSKGFKGLNRTVLHYCAIQGDMDLMKEVFNAREIEPVMERLVNAQDDFGETALMMSSIQGHTDVLDMLIDRSADPELVNMKGRTAIMLAAEHGFHECVRSLYRAGAKPDRCPTVGCTVPNARYLAELNQRARVLKTLDEEAALENDLDLNMDDEDDDIDANEDNGDEEEAPFDLLAALSSA